MLMDWIFVVDCFHLRGTRYTLDQSNAHFYLSSRPFCCNDEMMVVVTLPYQLDQCYKPGHLQLPLPGGAGLLVIEDMYALVGLHEYDFTEVSDVCSSMGWSLSWRPFCTLCDTYGVHQAQPPHRATSAATDPAPFATAAGSNVTVIVMT
jgi:hypothetical protein